MTANLSFLQNCFVIYDVSLCGEENSTEEDEILFFHPPGVLYETKFPLIGWCTAMINFAKSFTSHPLEVASLDKFKVAFKQIGSISMILTGTTDQPESTLVQHLDLLYAAFCFYNRSFSTIIEGHPSRKDLHQKMTEIGRELVPLLSHNFHKNTLRAFNALPYLPLGHKANRHFIQASQLLNFVSAEPGNISGCVIYKNSIVCTHLDFNTTRFVLNRLDYNKSSLYSSLHPQHSSLRGRMEPVCDFIPVYMQRGDVESLIKGRDNMFPFSNLHPSSNVASSSPYPIHQFMHFSPGVEDEEESVDGYLSLGLCIVSVRDLSIAILMTYNAFSNKQHIKKSIWKIPADIHFQTLETDLEAESLSVRTQPLTNPAANPINGNTNNTTTPNNGVIASPSVESTPSAPNTNFIRPTFLQTPLLCNARVVQSASYNFLTYDPLTESASVTPISTPQEQEFVQSISFMHHAFATSPMITEIIRKVNVAKGRLIQRLPMGAWESTGEIFGKQIFGREVYYQLKNGANISHDKFLEVIEKTVRTTLKDDHNINLI